MTTATGKGGLRPMSVARLRRLMTLVPTVGHFNGARARVAIAYWVREREDQLRARRTTWVEGDES